MVLEICFTVKPKSCKFCGSGNLVKKGYDFTTRGKKQKFACKECGKIFYGLNLQEGE